jgi:hypothetical protein
LALPLFGGNQPLAKPYDHRPLYVEPRPNVDPSLLRSSISWKIELERLAEDTRIGRNRRMYYFLCVVGEEVPPHEEWMCTHGQATSWRPVRAKR